MKTTGPKKEYAYPTSVQLTEKQRKSLRALSTKGERSISSYIREAVDMWLKKVGRL